MLLFSDVAKAFKQIEEKAGRLEMTDILAGLFKKTSSDEIEKLIYIIQGILAPPYEGIDLGLGERFAIAALSSSSGYSKEQVEKNFRKSGDLGLTAEQLFETKKQQALSSRDMDISYIYKSLVRMAKTSGFGSQDLKIKYLAELLNNSTPLEARFIIRFVTGQLRLGVGDPTILDALSVVKAGDKSLREKVERAYNICADLGYVGRVFFENEEQIKKFKVEPFRPLMPALAERLSNSEEIIDKIGECAVEKKFDGFRLQVHKKGEDVELYSRKLEKMTLMFPEVINAVKELRCKEIIFEAEALAYNEHEKKYYSFQQTMQRKRKHNIGKAAEEFPLNLFCFDILFLNGEDLTQKTYAERRGIMEKVFPFKLLKLSERKIVKNPQQLQKIFDESINAGLEGIMAKDLTSPYTAGKRKFAWIKLKKSYGKSVDTIDGVIVGYYLGQGSRVEFEFGGLLLAVYNEDRGKLETVAKIGSGFSEEEMKHLKSCLEEIKTDMAPKNLDYKIEKPDFWVLPKYVIEVAFDDITVSSVHTCSIKDGKGLALRFPRMVKIREDKGTNETSTSHEVQEMYEIQRS